MFVGFLPLVVAMVIRDNGGPAAFVNGALALTVLYYLWWIGRAWHVLRLFSDHSGRYYESRTRRTLPGEYRTSTDTLRERVRQRARIMFAKR